ncbi:MAG: CPBP family intramembrane metalloprotease [Verrucomicrobia bacterium]|nr:CPBP family intramembrane metalloprotease [Verrucomicrobiota bacterium]
MRDALKPRATVALLLLVPVPSFGTAAAMFWWPELTLGKAIFFAAKVWLVLLPLVWRLLVDREPLSWSPARHGGFGLAIASGVLISLVIFGAYALMMRWGAIDASQVAERAAKTGLSTESIFLGGALYWITVNSLMEEYVWRWFVLRKCEVLWGGKTGLVVAALAFTAHHVIALAAQFNWGITLLGSLGVFIGGATWNWLYLRYRSIWPGYVSHAIVDLAIFIIGYRLIFGQG